jgi:hypothetical protein
MSDALDAIVAEQVAAQKRNDQQLKLYAEAVYRSQQLRMQAEREAAAEQREAYRESRDQARDAREAMRDNQQMLFRLWEVKVKEYELARKVIEDRKKELRTTFEHYWKMVAAGGKQKANGVLSEEQTIAAASAMAMEAYQGVYQNQRITSNSDSLLHAEKGFYSSKEWQHILSGLKNNQPLVNAVQEHLVEYASASPEDRPAILERYKKGAALSAAVGALSQQTQSRDEAFALLQRQEEYLDKQTPAPPDFATFAAQQMGGRGAAPSGGAAPGPRPEARAPRAAFGGFITTTDEKGKKHTYMVPTEQSDDTVVEAMDKYNRGQAAKQDTPEDYFSAHQSFNKWLNSPEGGYGSAPPPPEKVHLENVQDNKPLPGPM